MVLSILGRFYRLLEIIFQGFWAKFLEKWGGQVTCRVESFDGRLTPLLFVELRFFWREFKIHTSRPSLDFARRTYVPWYHGTYQVVPSGTSTRLLASFSASLLYHSCLATCS